MRSRIHRIRKSACILLYPDVSCAFVCSRWICIRQMVKGQGVDTYVGLYSDCNLMYSIVSLPDPGIHARYIKDTSGYIRIHQGTSGYSFIEPPPFFIEPPTRTWRGAIVARLIEECLQEFKACQVKTDT